jgi:hypothetical protein
MTRLLLSLFVIVSLTGDIFSFGCPEENKTPSSHLFTACLHKTSYDHGIIHADYELWSAGVTCGSSDDKSRKSSSTLARAYFA